MVDETAAYAALAGRAPAWRSIRRLVLTPLLRGLGAASPSALRLVAGRFPDAARVVLSLAYLRGTGIEIGALHYPLPLAPDVTARYVDRMSRPALERQYPELRGHPLVEVDIVDDGETLASIDDGSQDFVVANHFIEHCQDPIGALQAFARVLRPGGVLYLGVPDMRFTFDRDRSPTDLRHLLRDHREGPEWSRASHYWEWVAQVEPQIGRRYAGDAIAARAEALEAEGYSIHFHAWTPDSFAVLLDHCIRTVLPPSRIAFAGAFNANAEMIFVLRKL